MWHACRSGLFIAGVTLIAILGFAATGRPELALAPALRVAPIEPGEGTAAAAAGPIFFYDHRPSRLEWGVRPLISWSHNDENRESEFDLLFPLFTHRTTPVGSHWQLLQLLRWSTGTIPDQPTVSEWMLFPLVTDQWIGPDSGTGVAFFPFYGSLRQFMGQEQLQFAFFPLWLSTERNQIIRHHILWPFFGWATAASETAPRAHGWRFWPFYGELIQEGVREERFALWPLFLHQRLGLNSNAPQEELAVLPFYDMRRSPDEQSTTWLWPLFNHTVRPASHYSEWDLPWPLIRFGSGDEKTVQSVLPFYNRESRIKTVSLLNKTERVQSVTRSLLWPLYHSSSDIGPDWRRNREEVLLVLYSDVRAQKMNPPEESRRIALWPFFTYNKTADGAVNFQTLAPIEPFLNADPITRNYSPLWSLATYHRNQDAAEFSFLWGLIQWRADKEKQQFRLFSLLPLWSQRLTAPPPAATAASQAPEAAP